MLDAPLRRLLPPDPHTRPAMQVLERTRAHVDTTLLKGLRALETVARSTTPMGATELGRQLDITKSNAHRILKTLEAAGFLRRVGSEGRYTMTLRLWELGQPALAGLDLKTEAHDSMSRLARDTRETVHLSLLDGAEVLYLDKIESPEPVRAYTTIGGRAPAYAVATGKALLAHASPSAVDAVGQTLVRHTAATVADGAALLRDLEAVRERGYAVNRGEWRDSVAGVAAPIRNASGEVEAAIGISAPRDRLTDTRMDALAPLVMQAATEVSLRLGWRPDQ